MKRASIGILLSIALVFSMLSGMLVLPATAQEVSETQETFGDGDCNGDGEVNMLDFMVVMRYIHGTTTLTAAQKQHLDVFGDGVVDSYDALCLFHHINETTDTLGGAVQARNDVYAQLALENAVFTQPIAAGDTVEIDLTAAAMADLIGLELHIAYDDAALRFTEVVSVFESSLYGNDAPVSATGGELWLSLILSDAVTLSSEQVIATLRFEALTPITSRSVLSFSMVKAVSAQAIEGLYTQKSDGEDGAVTVETVTTTTTATIAQNYVTYTIETVAHEGSVAAGETVELDISASAAPDFNGMQINLCFDDTEWEWVEATFVGAVSGFSYKTVNTEPLHPLTDKGEVWLTAMDVKGHALMDGETIATVKLKALKDIQTDSVIGACYSQASSFDGTMKGYEPLSTWVDGGVKITKKTYTGPIGDYFYKNNVRLNAYQLVAHNGDFYFVGDSNKLAKSTTVYLSDRFVAGYTYADGTALTAGNYAFDENGKMIIRNGAVGDYFYRNNTRLNAYQLVEYEGDYYFINDANKTAKNQTVYLSDRFVAGHTYADGTALTAGNYAFDENGKMIIRNGVVGDYLYRNNTMLKAYQLVEYEGDYYFINDANKLAKNQTVYLNDRFVAGHTYADGTAMTAGGYAFDENGKMIIRNGVVGDYLYRNNTMLKAYQLVEYEGDYYFINDANKLAKNTTVHLNERFVAGHTYADGTAMTAGAYAFDENGKMIIKNGVVGDFFYRNNTRLSAYQLVEYEGDFYFIGDANKVVKGKTQYLSEKYVDGIFTEEGYPLFAGNYTFDENGKMIL